MQEVEHKLKHCVAGQRQACILCFAHALFFLYIVHFALIVEFVDHELQDKRNVELGMRLYAQNTVLNAPDFYWRPTRSRINAATFGNANHQIRVRSQRHLLKQLVLEFLTLYI